jgi:hypothetical protein
MIQFRQKTFSEYDAMRSLYVELLKRGDKNKWKVIDRDSLIPVLRGNNVVIERFVISTSFAHRDRYRLYLKIGAKAKLPDEVRLPERVYDKRLGNATLNFNMGLFAPGQNNNNNNNQKQKNMSVVFKQKEFKGGGAPPTISASVSPSINLTYEVRELLGEAVKYDKKERSLVLEFQSIEDAIRALNILPFGINYNIFLLV